MKNNLYIFIGISAFWLIFFLSIGLLNMGLHLDLEGYALFSIYFDNGQSIGHDMNVVWQALRANMIAPVGISYDLITCKLFGEKVQVARWGYLLIGILSSFLLFLVGRKMKFSIVLSLLFPAIAFLGQQFSVWYSIDNQEPIGLLFMSLSLYLTSLTDGKKGLLFDFLAILAGLCMSLSKETFILMLPALVVFKFYISHTNTQNTIKTSILKSLLFATSLFIIFILEISYILFVMKGTGRGYAGVSGTLGIAAYLKNFFYLFLVNDVYFYALTGALLTGFATGGNFFENIKKFVIKNFILLALVLGIVIPQVIVYARTGWLPRYYLPCFVGISLFLVIVLNYLQSASTGIYKLFLILLVFYIGLEITPKISDNPDQTFRHARNHATFADNTEQLIASIVSKSKPNSLILIVTNPVENILQPKALSEYLQNFFHRTNIKHLSVNMPYKRFANYKERQIAIPNDFGEIKDKSSIEHIVVMPYWDMLFIYETKSWFDPTKYDRYAFWELVHYVRKEDKSMGE
ncbi:MAG: hypothetical protein EAZ08_12030 [Cytophagales bacterium]|nr:MAG: hypothetical protein EAZ08_12030 [Cytophagales bacterium]